MEQKCEICNNTSEAEVCDNCVKRFCKIDDKGCCYYCLEYSCIEEANRILCPICRREVPENKWEKHHLIPKSKDGKVTIFLCNCCGDTIHKVFTLNELRDKYNTIESIVKHPNMIKWINWANKKPNDFTICMKEKKRK